MSQENVDLIRSVYDAWDRNESARVFIAEDIEYVNPSYAVEPGVRRGRKSLAAVRDTYEDFELRVERFLDAGDRRGRARSLHGLWARERRSRWRRTRLRVDRS